MTILFFKIISEIAGKGYEKGRFTRKINIYIHLRNFMVKFVVRFITENVKLVLQKKVFGIIYGQIRGQGIAGVL